MISILYWCISFWLISLCIIGSSFIHLIRTDSNLFFQRTSFWLCWFLLWSLLFFSAFISALIFKISFLLLTLGFSIFSFSYCFRCGIWLFIWLFSFFLRYACIANNFPLIIGFIVSHNVRLLCFHFHSFLRIFWFLFWFLLWFVGYSEVCCSTSICWNF